jgi:chromosome partitioning protein
MKIISFVSIKGGVGKSTLSRNFAFYLADKTKKKVFLVDADPQKSLTHWYMKRKTMDNYNTFSGRLKITEHPAYLREITRDHMAAAGCDYVIIDSPPEDDQFPRAIISISDYIIIPTTPGADDYFSTKRTTAVLEEGINKKNLKLKYALFVNRKLPGTVIGKEYREALSKLNTKIFKNEISNRVAVAESSYTGLTVSEYAPNSKAKSEIDKAGKEIVKWLNQNQ